MDDARPRTKRCDRCHEQVPLGEFHKNRRSRDGLQSRCKPCTNAARRQYRQAGPDPVRDERREVRRAAVREAVLAAGVRDCTRCRVTKPLAAFSKKADHFSGFSQRCKSCQAAERVAYYRANRKAILAANRRWYEDNRERFLASVRAWQKRNPELRRTYHAQRRALLAGATVGPIDTDQLWSGLCGLCGDELSRTLRHPDPLSPSLDHIIPLSLGGSHEQSNLQWTHLLCNVRKGARPSD